MLVCSDCADRLDAKGYRITRRAGTYGDCDTCGRDAQLHILSKPAGVKIVCPRCESEIYVLVGQGTTTARCQVCAGSVVVTLSVREGM
jgi:uncharacterized paraquat-inducible protein A